MYKIKSKLDVVNLQNQGEKQEIETKVQNWFKTSFRSNAYVTNFYVKNQISKSGNLFEWLKHKTKCMSILIIASPYELPQLHE